METVDKEINLHLGKMFYSFNWVGDVENLLDLLFWEFSGNTVVSTPYPAIRSGRVLN